MPLPSALVKKLAKRGIINVPKSDIKNSSYKGYEGCPNKCNIWHNCTKYCIIRWKVGILEPTTKCAKQREKYLKKYPIPLNWKEIYDRGCGRFYYWDTRSNIVSWLPPKHPNAKLSPSAAYLREERMQDEQNEMLVKEQEEKRKKVSDEKESKRTSKYKKLESLLDPMDPSAYSNVPKGTWATGLQTKSESKTNVNQGTGPLYQIRMYYPPDANTKKK